jgi:hypothetical protein
VNGPQPWASLVQKPATVRLLSSRVHMRSFFGALDGNPAVQWFGDVRSTWICKRYAVYRSLSALSQTQCPGLTTESMIL